MSMVELLFSSIPPFCLFFIDNCLSTARQALALNISKERTHKQTDRHSQNQRYSPQCIYLHTQTLIIILFILFEFFY